MDNNRYALIGAVLLTAGLQAASAPRFTLKELGGATFRLADQLGRRPIVLDFWATWCGPCTRSLKKLQELKEQFPEALMIAVSIDDGQSVSAVNSYVQGRGFTFKVLLDPDSTALRLFNPSGGVPTTVIIDRQGAIAYNHVGYLPGDEKAIADLLRTLAP
jgi:peroxiredoxin